MPHIQAPYLHSTASRHEETQFLEQYFNTDHRDKHALFLPTATFYDKLQTNQGLTDAALELCRWIGIKPQKLRVQYGAHKSSDPKTIMLNQNLIYFPYHAAQQLAVDVIQLLLVQKRYTDQPSRSLLEHATIYLGLSAITLNALYYTENIADKWHRVSKYHITDKPYTLVSYSPETYLAAFIQHCKVRRINCTGLRAHLNGPAAKRLPAELLGKNHGYTDSLNPKSVQHIKQSSLINFSQFLLITCLIGIAISSSIYLWQQSPKTNKDEIAAIQQQLRSLNEQYVQCSRAAQDLQNTYNGDDIFIERRIDAIRNECQSIKNQFNDKVLKLNEIAQKNPSNK